MNWRRYWGYCFHRIMRLSACLSVCVKC